MVGSCRLGLSPPPGGGGANRAAPRGRGTAPTPTAPGLLGVGKEAPELREIVPSIAAVQEELRQEDSESVIWAKVAF